MKRGVLICILIFQFIFLATLISAEGDSRNNYENLLIAEDIYNGHNVQIFKFNRVYDTGECLDFHGFFNIWKSKQGQRIVINGNQWGETQEFEQHDNWEHCPRTDNPHRNYEHWSELINLHQEGNEAVAVIRNFGGYCLESPGDPPNFPQDCIETYDQIETLRAPVPGSTSSPVRTACAVGSGPCCSSSGYLLQSDSACDFPIQQQSCDQGICAGQQSRYGAQFCSGNSPSCDGQITWSEWTTCTGGRNSRPETCNELDDNCDGRIDENTRTCIDYNTCGAIEVCGTFCPSAPNERCDGIDNDCNEGIDEGYRHLFGRQCTKSLCQGTYACGEYGNLNCDIGHEVLTYEICDDGIDNNCDGTIDNQGCFCQNGATQVCGTDLGECQLGTSTCSNGQWGQCSGSINPQSEICNGLDDNCNGQIDDMYSWTDRQNCEENRQDTCEYRGGTWLQGGDNGNGACCGNRPEEGPPYQTTEICGDNLDNNCNGQTDEWSDCPVRCNDGTLSWPPEGDDNPQQCSVVQPWFCEYRGHPNQGSLIVDCQLCGCPEGYQCTSWGMCLEDADNFRPLLREFYMVPGRAALTGQTLEFHAQLTDESNILFVRLHYAYFDHRPTDEEIYNAPYQQTFTVFYDDGQHNDGAAGDKMFVGILPNGFGTQGYYYFKIESSDIHGNVGDEILDSYGLFVLTDAGGQATTTLVYDSLPVNPEYQTRTTSGSYLPGYEISLFPTIQDGEGFYSFGIFDQDMDLQGVFYNYFTSSQSNYNEKYYINHQQTPLNLVLTNMIPDQAHNPQPPLTLELAVSGAQITSPQPQQILLDFDGATNLELPNGEIISFGSFDAHRIYERFGSDETQTIKQWTLDGMREFFAPYNVQIFTTDGVLPQGDYSTIYFTSDDAPIVAERTDIFNQNKNDFAIAPISSISGLLPPIVDSIPVYLLVQIAGRISAIMAAHQAGHLLGLTHVDDDRSLMYLTEELFEINDIGQIFELLQRLGEVSFRRSPVHPNVFPTGYDNHPEKLLQTVGPRP